MSAGCTEWNLFKLRDTMSRNAVLPQSDLFCISAAAATAKSLQSCPILCNPRDGSPPGSPVPGILHSSTAHNFLYAFLSKWICWLWRKCVSYFKSPCVCLVAQLCPILCDPKDCSLPGSSVLGILQQEHWRRWPFPSPEESSWCRDWTPVSYIAGGFFAVWATREAPISSH